MKRIIRLPKLHPYQSNVLVNAKDVNVVIFGRRAGKTIMSGILAIHSALNGAIVTWVAPNYKNTTPLWEFCIKHLRHLQGNGVQILKSDREIRFESGGIIRVFSAENESSMLGFDADIVIIDEAARIKSSNLFFEVLRPTLADRNGKAFLVSTPRGKNWLYKEYLHGIADEPGYASFNLPTIANPNPNIRSFVEKAKATTPDILFEQEYLAQFISDGDLFTNVQEICNLEALVQPVSGSNYIGGIDFARHNDYTVLTLFDADSRNMVYMDRFTGLPYSAQINRIKNILDLWQPYVVVAETNNMGEPLVEFLQESDYPISGITTTAITKKKIIDDLVLAFSQKSIRLLDNPDIIMEFLSYGIILSPSGIQKYGGSGTHDDIVMSTAFAYSAFEDSSPLVLF